MDINVSADKVKTSSAAADFGASLLQNVIDRQGCAHIILATGASQFQMLAALVEADVDWPSVTGFHLDEYLELPESHPASFRGYLKQRFVEKVPVNRFIFVDGETDPISECTRLANAIGQHPIDVAFIGIGENGHLAFNDPPADFEVDDPYIVVDLDLACRKQQTGEGWFATVDDVPTQAISMSIRHIMKSDAIVCTAPDECKADAVQRAIEGPVTPAVPASILQRHPQVAMFLDQPAASRLNLPSTKG